MYHEVKRYTCDKCFTAYTTPEEAIQCFHQKVPSRRFANGMCVVFDLKKNGSVYSAGGKIIDSFLSSKHEWLYVVQSVNVEILATTFNSFHTDNFVNFTADATTIQPLGFYQNFLNRLKQPY